MWVLSVRKRLAPWRLASVGGVRIQCVAGLGGQPESVWKGQLMPASVGWVPSRVRVWGPRKVLLDVFVGQWKAVIT